MMDQLKDSFSLFTTNTDLIQPVSVPFILLKIETLWDEHKEFVKVTLFPGSSWLHVKVILEHVPKTLKQR